ncbi:UNVERIFIED_CONTAM: GDSL esterase/lipase [Sesamum angustifolium]|uniref:GDSL esterase/lipase n=1 Tax=Sesamum angustifolium TaxID=2727405 RepID=A0AAW2L414_9LAMI
MTTFCGFVLWVVFSFWCLTGSLASKVYSQSNNQGPQVPCLFIFGDSLVDNGNNNDILTLARADYGPYGIDFPQGATGRFTNGRTFVDILAQLLGFPNYILPYARARGRALLQGANYASGASGIRDETGNNLGDHMSMNQQVNSFARTVQQLSRYFKGDGSALGNYLSKCIFYSGLGSNDYLNNYFMTDYYSTSSEYTPRTYAASLIQDYTKQLTELYNLGARKVVVTGVGQIGCIPYQLARYDGFEVVDEGCCGVGKNNGQITCLPLQTPCDDRQKYLFWDAFHPTEAANILLAKKAYISKSKSHAYPINIQQLAML